MPIPPPLAPIPSTAVRPRAASSPSGARAAGAPLAVAVAASTATAIVATADPGNGGFVPCPIRGLTGHWCPGCGLTRATHHLLHGDVATALHLNALTPLLLGALVTIWFVWLRVATGAGVPAAIRRIRPSSYVFAGSALVAFTVVRNLPGAEALRGG